MTWHAMAGEGEIEVEDVIEVAVGDGLFAVYHTVDGFFVTDGICTHERARLADGLVIGNIIECPKHQGRFDVRTGAARGAPACINLGAYATRVTDGVVYADLPVRVVGPPG